MNPKAGGAEVHLHEVYGRLAAKGHEVTLLVSGWKGAPARASLDGMRVHRTGGRYTFSVAAPWYYRRRLESERFDVLVEDLNKVPLYAPYWASGRLVLLVHHLFGATAFGEASFPIASATWLLERPLPLAYRRLPTIAVSESTAQDLVRRGFTADGIAVIPNGVDATLYSPDPDGGRFERPTMLYLGRLKRYKRVDLVIRALAELHQRGTGAELVIAGRGDDEALLRDLAQRLGVEHAVRMTGYVDEEEKRTLFRRAWVHVLTSRKEGWGISNLEAAACGTCSVASDSPGLRDSVRHGETGFLVPHGDVAALADRLQEVLSDANLRDALGRGARSFAESLSWERSARRTEGFLEAVIRGEPPVTMKDAASA